MRPTSVVDHDFDGGPDASSAARRTWDGAYADGDAGRSWFQERPEASLGMLALSGIEPTASVIDVGGGASPLVDHLIGRGHRDLTVLDVAPAGLDIARRRLGDVSRGVRWVVADLRTWRPERTYDVWHDRAVLHFMVSPADRAAYLAALTAATAPGSVAVLGCFALHGPEQCSGQPVRRYDAAGLQALLGQGWRLVADAGEDHRTPDGRTQPFTWGLFRRTGAPSTGTPSASAVTHEDLTEPTERTKP